MSQNSLAIPTTGTLPGLTAMQDVNAALDTLNTLASGGSAPSSPEPGQLWHDTGNSLIKIRSMDNTTWIVLLSLNETNYQANAVTALTPRLYGLGLSNDATTPNTVIDIAPGGGIDLTATYYISLAALMKKNMGSAWAAGSGNGGLDTGSLAASAGYNVHLIYNPTTKTADVIGSLSYGAPALTTGWSAICPIGGFTTDASSHIRPFVQHGDEFLYVTSVDDLAVNPSVTTAVTTAVSVPTGPKVDALIRANLNTVANSNAYALLTSLDESDQAPSVTFNSLYADIASGGSTSGQSADLRIRTNASGQIRYRCSATGSSIGLNIWTKGFIYPRGLQ